MMLSAVAEAHSLPTEFIPKGWEVQTTAEGDCNDGVLLRPLTRLGVRCVGVDPSNVARQASQQDGWKLYPGYFDARMAAEIQAEEGLADVVTAHNVFAHVDDPNLLVEGIKRLLVPNGRCLLGVHYQGDLLDFNQFDTVYHEHTCYYSLRSLVTLFARHDMILTEVRRAPIHCGSIIVTACHQDSHCKPQPGVAALLAQEATSTVADFQARVLARKNAITKLLTDLRAAGRRIVAYGASGRATVLLNFCNLGPELLDHVSDLSPLRYGRVVPGVKVPILPRAEFQSRRADYALMTAWNYEPEILADEKDFLRDGGVFIVPLPELRIVSG